MAKGKYKEWLTAEGLHKIMEWARQGLTNEQIAQNMGIAEKTFYRWLEKYSQLSQALKKGRAHALENVENALYKHATGFYEGKSYFPPDTVAGIYLTKNWDREHYRDKPRSHEEERRLKLENDKLELENAQLEMKNEMMRRVLESDNETDLLKELIGGLEHAAVIDAKDIPG